MRTRVETSVNARFTNLLRRDEISVTFLVTPTRSAIVTRRETGVEILSKVKSLRAALESEKASLRHYGKDMAKKIQLRLTSLRAAESLADFWPPKSGPERCHELQGQDAGIFSVDVKQPYRLLFRPTEVDNFPDRSDEHGRWKTIKSIELLKIEDTHG